MKLEDTASTLKSEEAHGDKHPSHIRQPSMFSRGDLLRASLLASVIAIAQPLLAAAASLVASQQYNRWWVFPLAPFANKKTVVSELVPDQVWAFDQVLGALFVWTPIRMTIVRLKDGLLAYAPVCPTPECVAAVRRLEEKYGPLRHVILPSPAIEHKTAAGPFARMFPSAQLWVTPHQYSVPFGLDNLGLLGYTQLFWGLNPLPLPEDGRSAPWAAELDMALLGPLRSRGGQAPGLYEEAAVLHRASRTLLVTDVVQSVPTKIPQVLLDDLRALLFHARDNVTHLVADTPETRQRGWERIALFSLFFQPGGVDVVPWAAALPAMSTSPPAMAALGWGGLFPFKWRPAGGPHPAGKAFWRESFDALAGRTFVPAVLQKLVLDREPARVLAFADRVATWDFERIVPAHLASVIPAGPAEFRQAFRFLEGGDAPYAGNLEALPLCGDGRFLEGVSDGLVKIGSVGPPDDAVETFRALRRAKSGAPAPPPPEPGGWGPFHN